jgi:DNA polymerase III alpha subunit
MAEEYIERVNGRSKGDIEILDRLLPETHGVFVFQEQITKITKELTGWDDEKAEDIRIAVGKKKQKMIEELKPQFIAASAENDVVDTNTAQKIWAMMETFGGYGFNKSHAVGYAQIAYACAYLKHHYKLEWWAAVLSNADEKEITEVLWPHVKDILSPPDINLSNEEMVIDYRHQTIRNKLSALRGLGPKVADKITSQRPYADIKDFVRKKAAGNALTRKLIHVGVMDSLFEKELNLMEKMQYFENAVEENTYKKRMSDKSDGEIDTNLPIDKFITIAKGHPKTKRCKHVVKEGQIDTQYIFMNPIKDFALKKSIFPTMPMDLTDIIRENAENVKIINTEAGDYAINSQNREIRMVNGKMYQRIKNLPHQPGSQKSVDFCMACYVVEAKEFSYKDNTRKALRLIVDIDGHLEEFVQWPDYESGELTYPDGLKKNSVIFLFMYKKLGKEIYHTNISSIVVENIGVK